MIKRFCIMYYVFFYTNTYINEYKHIFHDFNLFFGMRRYFYLSKLYITIVCGVALQFIDYDSR